MPELFIAGSASVTSNEEPIAPQKKPVEGNDSFSKLLESGVEQSKKVVELQEDSDVSILPGDNHEATEAAVDSSDVKSLAVADPDNVGLIEPFIDSPDGNIGRQDLPVGGDFLPLTAQVTHAAAVPVAKTSLPVEGMSVELASKGTKAAAGSFLNVEKTISGPILEGLSPEGVTAAAGSAGLVISSASTAVPSIETALRETLPVEGRMATSRLQSESRLDNSLRNSANIAVPKDLAAGGQPIPGIEGETTNRTLVTDRLSESGARELALSSRFFSAGPPSQPSEPKSVIKAIRDTGLHDLSGLPARDWLSSGDQGRIQVERAVGLSERNLSMPPASDRSQVSMAAPTLPQAAMLESPAPLTLQTASTLPQAAMFQSSTALTPQTALDLVSGLKSTFTVPNTQAWVGEMRDKIDMVLASQRNEIELKLSPAHLGKIEVLIRRDDDQTALTFFAKNPEVRETLEQGLARLHRSFSEQGLSMGDTTVSDQSMAEHRDSESVGALPDESGEEKANPLQSDQPDAVTVTNTPIGLVNTWA